MMVRVKNSAGENEDGDDDGDGDDGDDVGEDDLKYGGGGRRLDKKNSK